MKWLTFLAVLSSFFMVLIQSCNSNSINPIDELPAKPIVKKTGTNYTQKVLSKYLPDTLSLKSMSEAYTNNYNEKTLADINNYIKTQVRLLDENQAIIDSILKRTYCTSTQYFMLPTFLEKTKYENKEAWLFQAAYGLGNSGFGHVKYFVFDASSLDTLVYFSCR